MPPRLTYWTGVWDPAREALSKEVESLRSTLAPGSPVISFSAGNRTSLWPRAGVIRLSGKRWLTLRAIAALVEPRGEVSHVFGAIDSWHLLRSVGRRPVVFTVAIPGPALEPALYARVRIFAAETDALARSLIQAGVAADRVRTIVPGVDLARFSPAPLPPARPFRLLFASTPSDPRELEARGVPILFEVARRLPDVEVVLLWRSWGDGSAARRALDALGPPPNVRVERRDSVDMPAEFASVHAVACLFADGFGKSCPNSVIEGLACGRPAILSEGCGIAGLVAGAGAGAVAVRTVEAVAAAVERVRFDLQSFSAASRSLAERSLGIERFHREYARAYEEARGAGP